MKINTPKPIFFHKLIIQAPDRYKNCKPCSSLSPTGTAKSSLTGQPATPSARRPGPGFEIASRRISSPPRRYRQTPPPPFAGDVILVLNDPVASFEAPLRFAVAIFRRNRFVFIAAKCCGASARNVNPAELCRNHRFLSAQIGAHHKTVAIVQVRISVFAPAALEKSRRRAGRIRIVY